MKRKTKQARADADRKARDLGERLNQAIEVHRSGDVPGAIRIYDELLAVLPNSPSVRHFLGMAQIHLRQFVAGEANVLRSLELDPDYADAWNSLGNLYRLTGRPEEALAAYQRVTTLAPDSVHGWVNLGDLYRQTRNIEGARRAFEKSVALSESDADESAETRFKLLTGLAMLRRVAFEWREAASLYEKALRLEPEDARCRRDLIAMLLQCGEEKRAFDLAQEWITRDPQHPTAIRVMASLTDSGTPERIADTEVAALFDGFATTFDGHLAALGYRAPALLADAVQTCLGEPDGRRSACDAGCGTGLCGQWLRPYANRLLGVDLSQGMLDLARERQLYDELDKAELTAWLADRPGMFDLVVSADTLCYFGSLTAVCNAAAAAMRPGGLLAFTVEFEDLPRPDGYHLQLNGRYTHNRAYVLRSLAEAQFVDVRAELADLRLEGGQPVRGLVVTARRA